MTLAPNVILDLDEKARLEVITALLTGEMTSIQAHANGRLREIVIARGEPFVPENGEEAVTFLLAVRELLRPFLTMRVVTIGDVEAFCGATLTEEQRKTLTDHTMWRDFGMLTSDSWLEIEMLGRYARSTKR